MLKEKVLDTIPQCCDAGFVTISDCTADEQSMLRDLFDKTRTVIVLAHHITDDLEWTWYPFAAERENTTCGADLHAKNVLEHIGMCLHEDGYEYCIVPYPGKCGIKMKEYAGKTELGEIGDNYMFLHRQWGPWVHLRLLLTDAELDNNTANTNVCIHCGKCIHACPAKVIHEDSFDGAGCSKYQSSRRTASPDNKYWKCEACARICPVGTAPAPLKITRCEE